jgi:type 1 fimbria pilin
MTRFTKALIAFVACLALVAAAASSSQAVLHWTINGSNLNSSETVRVGTHEGKHAGAWTLEGSPLGTPVEINAENIECGVAGGCRIEGAGASSGTLKYTGVTVAKPSSCTVSNPGGPIGILATNLLRDQIKMDAKVSGSTVALDEFSPVPSGGGFVEIEFRGAGCLLSGDKLSVKGTAEGEALHTVSEGGTRRLVVDRTGDEFSEQLLRFGATQQSTGAGALSLGAGGVTLVGVGSIELSGPRAGKPFGATE